MTPVRFGIVGIGNIGNSHAPRFLDGRVPGAELTAICDTDPARLARFPQVKGWTDSAALIRSGEIDALLIATPHYDHVPIGIDALNHGLHVLIEKPLAVHVADCERLLAAHTDPKQVFGVMFNTRTVKRYQKLHELLRSGELGRIRRINWILTDWFRSEAYYRSSPWRATWDGEGGGILVNQLPHDLDLFQWMFGLPKRVRAFCPLGKHHDIEVEDEINALMEFEDGATAVMVATTGEAPGTDRREIITDRGRVLVLADRLEWTRTEMSVEVFNRTTTEGFAAPKSEVVTIPVDPTPAGQHTEVIQRFVGAIHEGTPLIAPATEGTASVALANAIILSSWQDRTVELPLDAAAFEAALNERRRHSRYRPGIPPTTSAVVDMTASFRP